MTHPASRPSSSSDRSSDGERRRRSRMGVRATCAYALLVSVNLGLCGLASGEGLDRIDIDHAPVFLLTGAAPNLVMTLDDSGSMRRANSTGVPAFDARDTAAVVNRQYYDPEIVYLPPLSADGASFPHIDYTAAPRDFFRDAFCTGCQDDALKGALAGHTCVELCPAEVERNCNVSLETQYAPVWVEAQRPCDPPSAVINPAGGTPAYPFTINPRLHGLSPEATAEEKRRTAVDVAASCLSGTADPCPAFYHRLVDCSADELNAALAAGTPEDCLDYVEVGSDEDVAATSTETIEDRRLLLADGTVADDGALARRNFANWYAYYRNRWFTLQTAISRTLVALDASVRISYQFLDKGALKAGSDFYENQLIEAFGPYNAEGRQRFYDWLFSKDALLTTETPLLASAVRAFNFCSDDRAYLEYPQVVKSDANPIRACRNQFHLLFTDGTWDDEDWDEEDRNWLSSSVSNSDGTPHSLPVDDENFASRIGIAEYPADDSVAIFRDSNSMGLADIVFHSWITDLRPDEDDLVRTLIRDPARPEGEAESYVFWNPTNDPADWQHITTFTIGLGLSGDVSSAGEYDSGLMNITVDGFPGEWVAFQSDPVDPDKVPNDRNKVDDLWHAGVNGRGGYSLASDPNALIDSFRRIFATVSEAAKEDAAAAAPSFNSGSAQVGRFVFQATLNSEYWTGDVRAYRVSEGSGAGPCTGKARGALCEEPGDGYYWSAADHLDGNADMGIAAPLWATRKLVTGTVEYDADGNKTNESVAFGSDYWTSLADGDKLALLGLTLGPSEEDLASVPGDVKAMMDYVAGQRDYESLRRSDAAPYTFRDRQSLLGDVINASPVVVSTPNRVFNDPAYLTFATASKNRKELVYAGANDGMLHALDLDTGEEVFAYVPRRLFGKLANLTKTGYGSDPQHTNYVDGPIVEGDAKFADGEWNSVVVGALGLGDQSVYAIRSPSLTEDTDLDATKIHLWDFSDQDDADLGHVLGKPAIVRVLMSDGSIRWVAVFGNGYNSSTDDGRRAVGCDDEDQDSGTTACGRAVLYVVDIETGVLVAKFDTQTGRNADRLHSGSEKEPNGLGQPVVSGRIMVDEDGNRLGDGDPIANVAYAGDLFGNLWRFDLTGLSEGDVGEATLVFQTSNADGLAQPITAPPVLAPHPTGVGSLVLFGTGRYLALTDVSDTSTQTFYGIWDKGATGDDALVSRSMLQEQQLLQTEVTTLSGSKPGVVAISEGRTSTRNAVDWDAQRGWRFELIEDENDERKGERMVQPPQMRGDRVIFVSLIPETNPCEGGGFGWVNALAYSTGAALDDSPFDYDGNGVFDSGDLLVPTPDTPAEAGTSIRLAGGGIYSAPAALPLVGGETKTVVSRSDGDLVELLESSALRWRVWQQLQ